MNKRIPQTLLPMVLTTLGIALFATIVVVNPFKFHDHLLEPPMKVADFTLQTAGNKPFRLSDQRDNVVVLFFDYLNDSNISSTTLVKFKEAHDMFGSDAKRVSFVMITVDPDRDTPDKVAEYVAQFSPDFIGLGGSSSQLESVWKEFGAFVDKEKSKSEMGYIVMHTASVYVIDQNGILQMLLPYDTSATDLVDNVAQLLNK